jgi:hypothetical protein
MFPIGFGEVAWRMDGWGTRKEPGAEALVAGLAYRALKRAATPKG